MSIADGSGDNRPRHNDRDDTRGTGKSAGSGRNRDDRGAPRRGTDRKHTPEGRVGSGWGAARRDDRPGRNDDRDRAGDRRDAGSVPLRACVPAPSRAYGSGSGRGDGERDDRGRPNRSGRLPVRWRSWLPSDEQDRRGGRPADAGGRRDDRRPGDDRGERRWSRGGTTAAKDVRAAIAATAVHVRSVIVRTAAPSATAGASSADRRDDRGREGGPRYRTDDRGYRGGQTGQDSRSDDGGYRGGYRGRDAETGRRPYDRSGNRDDRGGDRPGNRGYRGGEQDATGRGSDRREYRGGARGGSGSDSRSDYRSGDRPRGYRAADNGANREGAGRRYDADDSRSRGYRSDRDGGSDFRPRDRTPGYRGSRDDGARGGFDRPDRHRARDEGGRSDRDRPGGYRRPDDAGRGSDRRDGDRYPARRDDRGDRPWSARADDRGSRNTYPARDRRDDARRGADRPEERGAPATAA